MKMGGATSIPLDLKDRDEGFVLTSTIEPGDYYNHASNQIQPNAAPKATLVPSELTYKVRLYQSVDLSFNHIADIPVSLPLTLPHLTTFNISHNKLLAIPDSIFAFIHLRDLDVSNNQLVTLPDSLTSLSNLNKLNIANNMISSLPAGIDGLVNLEKLNLSHNKLEHLPIALGNLPKLRVLLADKNELMFDLAQMCEGGAGDLIEHLRQCYQESQKGDLSPSANVFGRERGAVFESKILNSGSAQSFFTQMQSQAVNTGNRILTPMIPPPNATSLDSETIKDKLLGMFYGSVLGDILGVFTQFMSPQEASFYYDRNDFTWRMQLHIDEYRCHYMTRDVTLATQIVLIVLDSVMSWGGVVDELDFAKRLSQLLATNKKPLTSPVLQGISCKTNFVIDPQAAAKEWVDQKDPSVKTVLCDSYCLPAMIGLVVSQFHDLTEIERNASRICNSTHASAGNVDAAVLFAKALAKLLQGASTEESLAEMRRDIEGLDSLDDTLQEISHPVTALRNLVESVTLFETAGFQDALISVIFQGGEASVGCQVAGSVLGLLSGYSNLPPAWLNTIKPDFRKVLDKKLNTLLDVMGIP